MSDWCYNSIRIYGPNERLKQIVKEITINSFDEPIFTFSKVIPQDYNVLVDDTSSGALRAFEAYININNITDPEEIKIILRDPAILSYSDDSILSFVDMTKAEFIEKYSSVEYEPKIRIVDWYTWRMDNWGTKWDAIDSKVELDDDELVITFETAWGPPTEIVKALCEKYPDVEIEADYMLDSNIESTV